MTKSFADAASSLYVRTGKESCEKFLGKFLDIRIRPFALRVTGGCGLMGREHEIGLRNVQLALTGGQSKRQPRFTGFCLFGGTRMVNRFNPRKIRLGVTEVVPPLNRLEGAKTLGIIAKVGDMQHSRYGIIVSDDCPRDLPPEEQYVTIVHPTQDATLIVQPTADKKASWDDEAKECIDIMDYLRKGHWQGLMLVYNGGGVVEREINAWAKLGDLDPFWRVLLINGSGRMADKYANDAAFLAEHPTVHVCENSVESIRAKLLALGALVYPPEALFRAGGRR